MFTAILKGISLYLPYPALGLLISAGLTYLAIFFLPRFGFVDIPRGRHQHEKPIPRGGGIAIVTAFFLTVFLFRISLLDKNIELNKDIQLFFSNFWIPALIIFVVGVLDDRYELRSWLKLLFQIAVGVIFYLEGAGISKIFIYPIPAPIGLAITVGWSVVIINAFNLIDGLDGVAAGLAAIASFFLAVWTILLGGSAAMVVILLTFCASCLGFLRFNFSPARIFMGDTGSTFLGLFFAYISMQYSAKSVTLTALLVPLAAIGVPMFDVFLAIWRRFFRRYINKDSNSSIMQGDHDHLHHRILKETGVQRKTAWIIYALASGLCLLALIGVFLEESSSAMILVLLLLTLFVMIRYSSIELFDTLTCVSKGLQIPHRNLILTAIHPLLDGLIVLTAFMLTRYGFMDVLTGKWPEALLYFMHIAPFVLILCLSGIYRTYWLRAGIIQYYKLLRLLTIAGVAGYVISNIICIHLMKLTDDALKNYTCFYAMFFLLILAGILLERFLIHYYESWGYRRLFIRNQGKVSNLKKVLIYGGGLYCRIYATQQYCGFRGDRENIKIIGIIDDSRALRNLNVYGFNVLGTLDDLEKIYKKTPFDSIIIAYSNPQEDKVQLLRDFCEKHNVELEIQICRTEKF